MAGEKATLISKSRRIFEENIKNSSTSIQNLSSSNRTSGYAFSQDEHGTVTQADLIRKYNKDFCMGNERQTNNKRENRNDEIEENLENIRLQVINQHKDWCVFDLSSGNGEDKSILYWS